MKTIGITANLNKANTRGVVKQVIDFFQKRGVTVFLEKPLARFAGRQSLGVSEKEMALKSDIVIAVGGDGTFLRAARIACGSAKPVLGINLGELGFLAEIKPESIIKDLKRLIDGKYYIDLRMMLEVNLSGHAKNKRMPKALNDIVISKKMLSRLIDIDVFVNREYVTRYRADGLIVSTPTGSTAYNISAGGPIVCPGSKVIIISPICPHTLSNRPLVLSSNKKVEIRFGGTQKDIELTVDGQVGVSLNENSIVSVTESECKTGVILFRDNSYFKVLREKLGWELKKWQM